MSQSAPLIDPVPRNRFLAASREFFYGMNAYEFERQALELRGSLENVFIAVTLGDMLGLPTIPPLLLCAFAVRHPAGADVETPRGARTRGLR